ncbi:MAG: hypothetical protein ACRDQ4_26750 [Pseudonocardiaceae bacterium]
MLLGSTLSALLALIGLVALLTFVPIGRSRLLGRRQTAGREEHRRAKQRLQEVLRTVPGAELVVVQRIVSTSLRGTRAAADPVAES